MKGTLAYKDINGNVWSITEDPFSEYTAKTPDGVTIAAAFLGELLEMIDDVSTPEWTREIPAEPVQQEQLDLGAFPNE